MHLPNHASVLPEHVDPIPVPDTVREAELLCFLLDAGLYPRIQPKPSTASAEENGEVAPSTE